MQEALARATLRQPSLPIIANVTAQPVSNPDEIRKLLVEQVSGMVRWRESILYLGTQGVTSILEIGVGKVLTGLTKRIDKTLEANCVASVEDISAFAEMA